MFIKSGRSRFRKLFSGPGIRTGKPKKQSGMRYTWKNRFLILVVTPMLLLLLVLNVTGCKDKDEATVYTDEEITAERSDTILLNVPVADIIIDGSFDDWKDVSLIVSDASGDTSGGGGTDISRIRVAQSSGVLFFNMDLIGNYAFPHTTGFESTYLIGLFYFSDNKCTETLDTGWATIIHSTAGGFTSQWVEGGTADTGLAYQTAGSSMEISINLSNIPSTVSGAILTALIQYSDGVPIDLDEFQGSYSYCLRF